MAIADSGYIAPEHVQHGTGNAKADIYAFGVLLLELLTGRKPFDKYMLLQPFISVIILICNRVLIQQYGQCSTRPRTEQYLVRWASSKLHDNASLRRMVDPALTRTASSNSLSRYADIVSLCIQVHRKPQVYLTHTTWLHN